MLNKDTQAYHEEALTQEAPKKSLWPPVTAHPTEVSYLMYVHPISLPQVLTFLYI